MTNRTQEPRGIWPETRAAFDRMRATPPALAAFDRMRAAPALADARERARIEVRRIAALCAVVARQCLEIETLRAWREVAACTFDPFDWSRGGRELPS